MGREIKRVPEGFDWPLETTWAGFLNPFYKECSDCKACDGSGQNPAMKRIADDWYDFAKTGRRWCDAITQDEMDALVAAGRLRDFTHRWERGEWVPREVPATLSQVNEAERLHGAFVHDAINRMICVETRAKRLGVYGECEKCDGEGSVWTSKAAKALAEAWKDIPVPTGEWWQVWETVSEGSPVTPAFATPDELVDYLASGGDAWDRKRGRGGPSRADAREFVMGSGWAPTMLMSDGKIIQQGIRGAAGSEA
jgi:hypothetical protein